MDNEQRGGREVLMLPSPARYRPSFVVPVPMYGGEARLQLHRDMTEAEARKLANVVLAYAKATPFNAPRSQPCPKD